MTTVSPPRTSPGAGEPSRDRRESSPQWIAITPGSAKRTAVTVLLMLVALSIGLWMFNALSSFLFLLLLAWLISIAMEPPVLWLTRHGWRRGLATGAVMVAMLLLISGAFALLGQVFIAQVSQLSNQFPTTVKHVIDWVNTTFHTRIDTAQIQQKLQLTPQQLSDLAGKYGGGLLGVFGSLLTFVFDAVTILVFTYYLSADSPRLRQTIGSWLPPRHQKVAVTVWAIAVEKTGGYVISKVVLAALSAVAHVLFFWLINVPFWLPLGVLAGIVSQFIPTIGTYIGVLLPALFTLLDKPINALWIALFATFYQQIENYVLTPRISKRTMDVHPAVALAAVFAGAALLGPIGAIIGIPVVAALLTIIETFRRRHQLLPELATLEDRQPRPRRYAPPRRASAPTAPQHHLKPPRQGVYRQARRTARDLSLVLEGRDRVAGPVVYVRMRSVSAESNEISRASWEAQLQQPPAAALTEPGAPFGGLLTVRRCGDRASLSSSLDDCRRTSTFLHHAFRRPSDPYN